MKFPTKIPKGWRRLRLGERVPNTYKYYDVSFKKFLNGWTANFGTRNSSRTNLRIIPK